MSLQLPAILSPPTSCIPALALTVSCRRSGCRSRLAPSRVGFRFWASPFPSRLANASGRIVFNMVLFMDWQFVSGCSPPRLSTTQLPSTTDSQCSVRWGLSPHCWCALSGALGRVSPRPPNPARSWTRLGQNTRDLIAAIFLGLTKAMEHRWVRQSRRDASCLPVATGSRHAPGSPRSFVLLRCILYRAPRTGLISQPAVQFL